MTNSGDISSLLYRFFSLARMMEVSQKLISTVGESQRLQGLPQTRRKFLTGTISVRHSLCYPIASGGVPYHISVVVWSYRGEFLSQMYLEIGKTIAILTSTRSSTMTKSTPGTQGCISNPMKRFVAYAVVQSKANTVTRIVLRVTGYVSPNARLKALLAPLSLPIALSLFSHV